MGGVAAARGGAAPALSRSLLSVNVGADGGAPSSGEGRALRPALSPSDPDVTPSAVSPRARQASVPPSRPPVLQKAPLLLHYRPKMDLL